MDQARTSFTSASAYFCGVLAAVRPADFERPALGTWSVLELIAHGNRAHVTLVDYVERPVDVATVPADYFSADAIDRRAREAVAELGADPAGVVAAWAERARRIAAAASEDTVVGTPGGPVTLAAYLPSRTAELVLHGLDLAAALGHDAVVPQVPADSLTATAGFLAERATARGHGLDVVLGLSGRRPLPIGFSAY
jgi:uncharacterized protein (TIGR03083 family)